MVHTMCVCVCVCVCVYVCMRARAHVCVCDAQVFQSKLKLRGSTFLHAPQDISETMSSEFIGPRWQAMCVLGGGGFTIFTRSPG